MSEIYPKIKALIDACSQSQPIANPEEAINQFTAVCEAESNFKDKIKLLDQLIAKYGIASDVGELLFDLLLFQFFSEDSLRLDESYFESKEWEVIEELIIDRGTELMNLLLYLQECLDSEINPSLDDYLDEYLIAEGDFDNEEYEVYEAIIKNREEITEGNLESIVQISKANADSALDDQLLPLLLFFEPNNTIEVKNKLILTEGSNPGFQMAFLAVLNSF